MTFEQFMAAVDNAIRKACGLTSGDLDDWTYRDDFANRVSPERSAGRAIRNAKKNSGF